MPIWLSVNAVNPPTTYSCSSFSTFAWKAQISTIAKAERTSIPFEYTSRSPRFSNCRGMNRSRASSAARRGNPWNDVLAASIRIANVEIWMSQNMKPPPNTALASSDTTDTDSLGIACVRTDSSAVPRIIETEITPRIASVCDAFRPCGRRNALTPLEIASVPVSADEPEAKECRITNRLAVAAVPTGTGSGTPVTCGHDPRQRTRPTPISENIEKMKTYVGVAKASPDSRTPRRFTTVSRTTQMIAMPTRSGPRRPPIADEIARIPDETDTATVRT